MAATVAAASRQWRTLILCLALVVTSFALFSPVVRFKFLNFDDNTYLTENRHVRGGLSSEGLRWAFTSRDSANWHPLTWISHMTDVQLFGMRPGVHHLVNVSFHAANAVLLFLILSAATGAVWASAFAAALFAVHPLHVESVAWLSERKDVLATFFWMLSVSAYLRYLRAPGVGRYLLALAAFVLGLMAKPMVITLPFVLLLLDYWPLGRWRGPLAKAGRDGVRHASGFVTLVLEKAPFFAVCAASGVITYEVQRRFGAMGMQQGQQHGETFGLRSANAAIAYVRYLGKTVWPTDLSVFYPYPSGWPPAVRVFGAAMILAGICAGAVWWRRRHPSFFVGWFWFLGTLVPVIGLVQVGSQALADRYTYVPLIGLFVAASWGIAGWQPVRRWQKPVAWALGGATLCALGALASVQVGYWRDSGSLFAHAAASNPDDFVAHDNLGSFLLDQGRLDEAVAEFAQSIRVNPADYLAWFDTGLALCRQGKNAEARRCFSKALGINPAFNSLYNKFGRPCEN